MYPRHSSCRVSRCPYGHAAGVRDLLEARRNGFKMSKSHLLRVVEWEDNDGLQFRALQPLPARILIAAPAMPVRVTIEMADCKSINSFARRVRGNVSVGLKAKLVVKARYR